MSAHEQVHKHDSDCCCLECGFEQDSISVKLHENAIVGSVRGNYDCNINTAEICMSSAFEHLIDYANKQRALIGHIKGFVVCSDRLLTFSSTGGEITVKQNDSSSQDEKPDFNITAILFNVEPDSLKAELIKVLHAIKEGITL